MTDAENFLQRWSRRKIEAERQTPDDAAEPARPENAAKRESDADAIASPNAASATPPTANKAGSEVETNVGFDLSALPPIESITSATDIRMFMGPGVPAEITRAALRRAWSSDPAIRDFVGLAENAWDFTDPNATAGFGELPADFDVQKVVSQIFGEREHEPAQPEEDASGAANVTQSAVTSTEIPSASEANAKEEKVASLASGSEQPAVVVVQRDENGASHNHNSDTERDDAKPRRSHGRGLPQ